MPMDWDKIRRTRGQYDSDQDFKNAERGPSQSLSDPKKARADQIAARAQASGVGGPQLKRSNSVFDPGPVVAAKLKDAGPEGVPWKELATVVRDLAADRNYASITKDTKPVDAVKQIAKLGKFFNLNTFLQQSARQVGDGVWAASAGKTESVWTTLGRIFS